MRCGDTISELFPIFTRVRQGCVLAHTHFSTCMDWILGRMSVRSSCGASFGNVKISNLDFADDSPDHGVWCCRYLCRRMKVRVFRSLVHPVLLYGCEIWTVTRDLRRILNSFGARSLRRVLGYRWSDFVSNERLLRETQIRFGTCIVCER